MLNNLRYQGITCHWLDGDWRDNNVFGVITGRDRNHFSRHFGATLYNFFYKSYVFPMEDSTITAIVCDIHEQKQIIEAEEDERAMEQEGDDMMLEKRFNKRLTKKKRNS